MHADDYDLVDVDLYDDGALPEYRFRQAPKGFATRRPVGSPVPGPPGAGCSYREDTPMAKNSDNRDAWVEAQAEALYQDLKAREEAAEAAENTAHINGTHYGVSGGVHNGPITFNFK